MCENQDHREFLFSHTNNANKFNNELFRSAREISSCTPRLSRIEEYLVSEFNNHAVEINFRKSLYSTRFILSRFGKSQPIVSRFIGYLRKIGNQLIRLSKQPIFNLRSVKPLFFHRSDYDARSFNVDLRLRSISSTAFNRRREQTHT